MTYIAYLGFDPGAITGIAWLTNTNELTHETQTPLEACDLIYAVLSNLVITNDLTPDRIIVSGEAYTMGSSVRTHQPDALYILGAIRWAIHRFVPVVEFRITGAAEASRVGTRQTLTTAGWWIPGDPDQHRNRASAQVAHAMMMTEPKRWYDLINPSDQGDQSDQATDNTRRAQVPTLEDPVGQGS